MISSLKVRVVLLGYLYINWIELDSLKLKKGIDVKPNWRVKDVPNEGFRLGYFLPSDRLPQVQYRSPVL